MSPLEIVQAAITLILAILAATLILRLRRLRKHLAKFTDIVSKIQRTHKRAEEDLCLSQRQFVGQLYKLKARHEDDLVEIINRHDKFARGNLEQSQRMNELTAAKIVDFNEQNKNETITYHMTNPSTPKEFAEAIERNRKRENRRYPFAGYDFDNDEGVELSVTVHDDGHLHFEGTDAAYLEDHATPETETK